MSKTIKKLLVAAGVLALLMTLLLVAMSATFPIINDVTTDPGHPPEYLVDAPFGGPQLSQMAYNPTFAGIQRRSYPSLAPLILKLSPQSAYEAAVAVAARQPGWRVVSQDTQGLRFQIVATTALLRFKDDVVVTVSGPEGQAVVNVRSRSRIGKSDFGANAKRISSFLDAVSAAAEHK